jgi:hypothetical protein
LIHFGSMALLLMLWATGGEAAPPIPKPPVLDTSPIHTNSELQGNVLSYLVVADFAACRAQCAATSGCSGFNFYAGRLGPLVPGSLSGQPGRLPNPIHANCTLLGGNPNESSLTGVNSCRMPCSKQMRPPTPVNRLPPVVGSVLLPVVVPPLQAVPPTPVAGLSGYEVVTGPTVQIAPLAVTQVEVRCPQGKVALSAAYRVSDSPFDGSSIHFHAGSDPALGFEVRGALPDGDRARLLVRNANLSQTAYTQAVAVCVNAHPGLRSIERSLEVYGGLSGHITDQQVRCTDNERLVGGGVMTDPNTLIGTNAPQPADAWQWRLMLSSAVLTSAPNATARALCAPAAAVPGWQLAEAGAVSVGAASGQRVGLTCPAGKVMLAAGVAQHSNNLLDMIVSTLAPSAQAGEWEAWIHNRNVISGSGNVRATLAGLCANQP